MSNTIILSCILKKGFPIYLITCVDVINKTIRKSEITQNSGPIRSMSSTVKDNHYLPTDFKKQTHVNESVKYV